MVAVQLGGGKGYAEDGQDERCFKGKRHGISRVLFCKPRYTQAQASATRELLYTSLHLSLPTCASPPLHVGLFLVASRAPADACLPARQTQKRRRTIPRCQQKDMEKGPRLTRRRPRRRTRGPLLPLPLDHPPRRPRRPLLPTALSAGGLASPEYRTRFPATGARTSASSASGRGAPCIAIPTPGITRPWPIGEFRLPTAAAVLTSCGACSIA